MIVESTWCSTKGVKQQTYSSARNIFMRDHGFNPVQTSAPEASSLANARFRSVCTPAAKDWTSRRGSEPNTARAKLGLDVERSATCLDAAQLALERCENRRRLLPPCVSTRGIAGLDVMPRLRGLSDACKRLSQMHRTVGPWRNKLHCMASRPNEEAQGVSTSSCKRVEMVDAPANALAPITFYKML